jgi:very-short-patch-repair endonuclease
LAELLAERRLGVTESPLEKRFLKLVRTARLPEPHRQFRIRHGGRILGRADFAYPNQHIAIELDSWEWHGDRRSFESDRLRHNDLIEIGWIVLLITDRQMRDDADRVVRTIRTTIARQSPRAGR